MRLSFLLTLSLPLLSLSATHDQTVMISDDDFILPDEPNSPPPPTTPSQLQQSKPTLADLLTIENSASIFYSYARELEMSRIFADKSARVTLFVPTNKAVMALARKPHQGPEKTADDDIQISEEEFDRRSKRNVERWISAHIIPESPLEFEAREYKTMLGGKTISLVPIAGRKTSDPDWTRFTIDGSIHMLSKREGANGDLYMIDRSISTD